MNNKLQLAANPVGDNSVMFYLPEPVQESYPLILQSLAEALPHEGIVDYVIAYHSILVMFDQQKHSQSTLTTLLNDFLPQAIQKSTQVTQQNIIRIPVCYEGEFAIDIENVAQQASMSVEQVIKHHTDEIYTVCCLGFIPGFAFLGYVDDEIATPRRPNPRANVVAGSVGIAGRQTGVYPADSPGGWNIIGRTPMKLYDPEGGLYSRFAMGDAVQFYAMSKNEWDTYNADE